MERQATSAVHSAIHVKVYSIMLDQQFSQIPSRGVPIHMERQTAVLYAQHYMCTLLCWISSFPKFPHGECRYIWNGRQLYCTLSITCVLYYAGSAIFPNSLTGSADIYETVDAVQYAYHYIFKCTLLCWISSVHQFPRGECTYIGNRDTVRSVIHF